MARDLGYTIGELMDRISWRELKQWQAQLQFEAEVRAEQDRGRG